MLVNPAVPTNYTGTRIVVCLIVTIGAVCFLWVYSAVAHREPIVFPGKQQTATLIDRPGPASTQAISPPTPSTAAVEAAAAEEPALVERKRKINHRKNTIKAATKSNRLPVFAGKVRLRPEVGRTYAQAPAPGLFRPVLTSIISARPLGTVPRPMH
jgi:hypothetical protein